MPEKFDDEARQFWQARRDNASSDPAIRAKGGITLMRLALCAKSTAIQLKASDILADDNNTFAIGEKLMYSIFAGDEEVHLTRAGAG